MSTSAEWLGDVEPPWPTPEEEEQERKFRTFRNYVRAWNLELDDGLGVPSGNIQTDLDAICATPVFRKTQASGALTAQLERDYIRGELVLRAMSAVSGGSNELAACMALWLPVQAYYAIHGLGCASLQALGQPTPYQHKMFRVMMASSLLPKYFPGALQAKAVWDEHGEPKTEGIRVDGASIKEQSNLATPSPDNKTLLVAKSLTTTHNDTLDDEVEKYKRREKKKRLPNGVKSHLRSKMHPSTILDLLWRMRTRANYSDPAMYLHPSKTGSEAVDYCQDITALARRIALVLRAIIRTRLGHQAYEELNSTLPNE